jgi:hypothetical protein
MTAILIAILSALLAGLIQVVILDRRRILLRAKEQCFRFHELRDMLQILAIEGKIKQESRIYQFLFFMINVAIRNAGVMKLSDLLRMSKTVKTEVEGPGFEAVTRELRSYPAEVQILASDVFNTFAKMLVVNDDLTFLLFNIATNIANIAAVQIVKSIAKTLTPQRAEVVRQARSYRLLGQRMAPA